MMRVVVLIISLVATQCSEVLQYAATGGLTPDIMMHTMAAMENLLPPPPPPSAGSGAPKKCRDRGEYDLRDSLIIESGIQTRQGGQCTQDLAMAQAAGQSTDRNLLDRLCHRVTIPPADYTKQSRGVGTYYADNSPVTRMAYGFTDQQYTSFESMRCANCIHSNQGKSCHFDPASLGHACASKPNGKYGMNQAGLTLARAFGTCLATYRNAPDVHLPADRCSGLFHLDSHSCWSCISQIGCLWSETYGCQINRRDAASQEFDPTTGRQVGGFAPCETVNPITGAVTQHPNMYSIQDADYIGRTVSYHDPSACEWVSAGAYGTPATSSGKLAACSMFDEETREPRALRFNHRGRWVKFREAASILKLTFPAGAGTLSEDDVQHEHRRMRRVSTRDDIDVDYESSEEDGEMPVLERRSSGSLSDQALKLFAPRQRSVSDPTSEINGEHAMFDVAAHTPANVAAQYHAMARQELASEEFQAKLVSAARISPKRAGVADPPNLLVNPINDFRRKAIIALGPSAAGKTTMTKRFLVEYATVADELRQAYALPGENPYHNMPWDLPPRLNELFRYSEDATADGIRQRLAQAQVLQEDHLAMDLDQLQAVVAELRALPWGQTYTFVDGGLMRDVSSTYFEMKQLVMNTNTEIQGIKDLTSFFSFGPLKKLFRHELIAAHRNLILVETGVNFAVVAGQSTGKMDTTGVVGTMLRELNAASYDSAIMVVYASLGHCRFHGTRRMAQEGKFYDDSGWLYAIRLVPAVVKQLVSSGSVGVNHNPILFVDNTDFAGHKRWLDPNREELGLRWEGEGRFRLPIWTYRLRGSKAAFEDIPISEGPRFPPLRAKIGRGDAVPDFSAHHQEIMELRRQMAARHVTKKGQVY